MKIRYIQWVFILIAISAKAMANEVSWNYNPYAFQYDMTIYIGLSTFDGNDVTDTAGYQIGAFCNDECRGIAERKSSGGHDYLYLRVRSNVPDGETINFRVRNLTDGKVADVTESVAFCSQQTVGYPSSPFMINARNQYEISFIIDGIAHTSKLYYGDMITAPEPPTKTGYTFAGWDKELPLTMPAEDAIFRALWTINKYKLIYVVDDVVYRQYDVEYGSVIIPEAEPEREGYAFSGWSEIPETMPAGDVKVVGTFALTDTGFRIEPNDLLALRNFYTSFDGGNWVTKWIFSDKAPKRTDFPGVTFGGEDELGYSHVVEITLDKNNVRGDVTAFTLHLPSLTALYLYGNELSGDLTTFVSELNALKTLDVRANALSSLESLPESVTHLEKGMQFRKDNASEWLDLLVPVVFYISNNQTMSLPGIITYDLDSHGHRPTLLHIMERGNVYAQTYFGTLNPLTTEEMSYRTAWAQTPFTYEYGQDYEVLLRTQDGTVYPAIIRYVSGDADMSGATDVLDVQTTISKILRPDIISLFNASAANTYYDELLNVQDVVAMVNIVLDNSTPSPASYMVRRLASALPDTHNRLYVDGERLCLSNETEVGAIDVTLRGVKADEVSLALSHKDFQLASRNTAGGSRHILYSLSGKTIAAGTTSLLQLSHGQAEPADAILASVDGKPLDVTLGATPTYIDFARTGRTAVRFDGNRLIVSCTEATAQAEVSVISTSGQRLIHIPTAHLNAGISIFDAIIPSGVYVVRIESDGKVLANVKVVKIT